MAAEPEIIAAIIAASSQWIWETIGKTATENIQDHMKAGWDRVNWPSAENSYKRSLAEQHTTVRILGKSVPVSLEDIYTDVLILGDLSSRRTHGIEYLRRKTQDRFELGQNNLPRENGVRMVQESQNLFILGKPGAGKTTFLKHITLQALNGNLSRTPIFVSMKEWADSGDVPLMPFIIKQFEVCNFPNAETFIDLLLESGKAIVLFDGLDEVNQEGNKRNRLMSEVDTFLRKYSKCQILITCRIAATDKHFTGFRDVEIADFSREQVHKFVEKWFSENPIKRAAFIDELYRDDNQSLRELCSVPLLLSMLCVAFEDSMQFPKRRAELYQDALDALLRRWDASRNILRDEVYRNLSINRKLQLFSRIAAPAFESGEYYFQQDHLERSIQQYLSMLPDSPDAQDIDGFAVLKAIEMQHALFVERAKRVYSFSHLTFQEYFTAKYIIENQQDRTFTRLMRDAIFQPRWREVTILVASLLYNADDFCTRLKTASNVPVATNTPAHDLLRVANVNSLASVTKGISLIELRLLYLTMNLLVLQIDAQSRLRALANAVDGSLVIVMDCLFPVYSFPSEPDPTLWETCVDFIKTRYGAMPALDFALTFTSLAVRSIQQKPEKLRKAKRDFLKELHATLISLTRDASQPDIAEQVRRLTLPSESSRPATWNKYCSSLLQILHNKRSFVNTVDMSNSQLEELKRYLYMQELMIQCLNVATVSNRSQLQADLLQYK
ncbi:MAG: NACHT domain-containing protein [Caldilineaceae bacterium]|nr:NACHT domain-containing protein [Caldilineaceae bacterium]